MSTGVPNPLECLGAGCSRGLGSACGAGVSRVRGKRCRVRGFVSWAEFGVKAFGLGVSADTQTGITPEGRAKACTLKARCKPGALRRGSETWHTRLRFRVCSPP